MSSLIHPEICAQESRGTCFFLNQIKKNKIKKKMKWPHFVHLSLAQSVLHCLDKQNIVYFQIISA